MDLNMVVVTGKRLVTEAHAEWGGALMDIMMHQPDCLSWKDWLTLGARALVDSHSEIP